MATDHESTQEKLAALVALQDVALTLTSELNLERLLRKILHAAVEVVGAETGSLLIWDSATDELVFEVAEERGAFKLEGTRMPADQGIAGSVFTQCEPIIVHDVERDEQFFKEIDETSGYRTTSIIGVPLMTPSEKIGVIELLNKKSGEPFNEQDQEILCALAGQAAIAVVNARLYQELEDEKNRIIAIEDEVHKKLARDLHDGPAQTLAAMIMNLEFIQILLEREPGRVEGELQKLRDTAAKALMQVRNTLFELRPVVLETQGLRAAFESYVERLRQAESFAIDLQVRGLEERLPTRLEGICFVIVQEAIGNIKKHAYAQHAWVVVERQPNMLVLAVRDDGKGFDVEATERTYDERGSLGLLNMKERAQVVNGTFKINSALGKGTLVSLIVPLPLVEPSTGGRLGTGPLQRGNGTFRRVKGTGPLRRTADSRS